MSGLRFTEEMRGWLSFDEGETDPVRGERRGRRADSAATLHLTIDVDDVEAFLDDPAHAARAVGWLSATPLGGGAPTVVQAGSFNLFPPDGSARRRTMHYRLPVEGPDGPPTRCGARTVSDKARTDG